MTPSIFKLILVVFAAITAYCGEKFATFHRRNVFGFIRHLQTNISLWLINSAVSPILVLVTALVITEIGFGWRPAWLSWPQAGLADFWHAAPVLIIDILIIDCFIYFWHRANHEIPFLWRFHQVHHDDQIMDFTTGVRFHFGEIILSSCARLLVILLFDIGITSVVVAETLLLIVSLFQHGNFKLSEKWERILSKIIVTPGIHWVHHHKITADTDSNYANIFSWWDLLFATRSPIRRYPGMPIGIAGSKFSGSLWQQIKKPFSISKP